MKRRLLSLMLCILIIFNFALIGCSKKDDTSNNESTSDTGNTQTTESKETTDSGNSSGVEPLTLPIIEPGTVTLTIGTFDNWYAPASYTQNLEIFQAIEKDTGVKINWDVVPASQYNTSMQTRLAAGTNLPDIISIPGDTIKYAQDGLIIAIDELIKKYAPNTLKYFEADPLTKKVLTTPDGHIYSLASVTTGTSYSDPYAWITRRDWLQRVGVKEPTTIDEFYTMLKAYKKAYKEQDANGNGDPNDEIPLVVQYGVWDLQRFGDAWGLRLFYSYGWHPNENGIVEYDWLKPEAKELVTWLNKLYTEGLLDPEFLSTGSDERTAKITRNIAGTSTAFINSIETWDKALKQAGVADADHIALVPPAGPNGYKGHQEAYGPISGEFGITKDCKNPVVAIKWLDYVYASEKGFLYTTFGIEGKSYIMENGEPKYTEWVTNNPDGLSFNDALRSLGALPNIPYIRSDVGYWSKHNMAAIAHLPKTLEMAQKISPYIILAYPTIPATAEEAEKINNLMTDIGTYRDEMVTKFILGQEDLSKWDAFISTLKEMGIEEVLKLKQQQYDRFNKE